jgi:hypothetical protein
MDAQLSFLSFFLSLLLSFLSYKVNIVADISLVVALNFVVVGRCRWSLSLGDGYTRKLKSPGSSFLSLEGVGGVPLFGCVVGGMVGNLKSVELLFCRDGPIELFGVQGNRCALEFLDFHL